MRQLIFLIWLIPALVIGGEFDEIDLLSGIDAAILSGSAEFLYVDSTGYGVHLMAAEFTLWLDYEGAEVSPDKLVSHYAAYGGMISPIGFPGFIYIPQAGFGPLTAGYWINEFRIAVPSDQTTQIVINNLDGSVYQTRTRIPDTASRTDLNDYGRVILGYIRRNPLLKVYTNDYKIYPRD